MITASVVFWCNYSSALTGIKRVLRQTVWLPHEACLPSVVLWGFIPQGRRLCTSVFWGQFNDLLTHT